MNSHTESQLPSPKITSNLATWSHLHIKEHFPIRPISVEFKNSILILHPKIDYIKMTEISKERKNPIKEHLPKVNWDHWPTPIKIDYKFLHRQPYVLFDMILLIRYTLSQDPYPLLLLNPAIKSVEPVRVVGARKDFSLKFASCLKLHQLIFFGGINLKGELSNNLTSINLHTMTYTSFEVNGRSPSPRHSSSMLYRANKIYVVGGEISTDQFVRKKPMMDIHLIDCATNSWYRVESPEYSVLGLFDISCFVFNQSHLLIVGNSFFDSENVKIGLFDEKNNEFNEIPIQEAFPGRVEVHYYTIFITSQNARVLDQHKVLYIIGGIHFEKKKLPYVTNKCDFIDLSPITVRQRTAFFFYLCFLLFLGKNSNSFQQKIQKVKKFNRDRMKMIKELDELQFSNTQTKQEISQFEETQENGKEE